MRHYHLILLILLLFAACISIESQPDGTISVEKASKAPSYQKSTPQKVAEEPGEATPHEEVSSAAQEQPQLETQEQIPGETFCTPARVSRVIDGDTIDVVFRDGTSERVRLVGVDTPETKAPEEPEEYGVPDTEEGRACLRKWGYEAYRYTLSLQGREVCIVPEGRGYYGRLLAYVYTSRDDSTPLGYELVERGLARVYTESSFSLEEKYLQAEQLARRQGLGLWSCTLLREQESQPSVKVRCDPAYPDVCIPPSPPDLDCRDIPYRNFRVLPPDPHRFDRDRDGIGCES